MPPDDAVIMLFGFNEAGADCPGMLANRHIDELDRGPASMRPGQTAPECGYSRATVMKEGELQ